MCSCVLLDGRTFGVVRLNKLTWQDIEEVFAVMRSGGSGPDWIRRCATVVSRALDFARKRGLIDTNPAKDATRPRSSRTKPHSPTAAEVRALLQRVRSIDEELADAVGVLASTGMRKSELLALQWADVDLRGAEVHIAAAITDGGPGRASRTGPLRTFSATARTRCGSTTTDEPTSANAALFRRSNYEPVCGSTIGSNSYRFWCSQRG